MSSFIHTPSGVPTEMPYAMGASLGLVPTHSRVIAIGRNTNIGSGEAGDVCENGGNYNWLTAASPLDVVCSDLNDSSSGNGARTILIAGVDGNGDAISELVTTNGGTVTTTKSFFRRNLVTVMSAGSGNKNAGPITIRAAGGGVIIDIVPAGLGFGRSAVFSVPRNFTLFITSSIFSVLAPQGANSDSAVFGILRKMQNGNEIIPLEFQVTSEATYRHDTPEGIIVPQRNDILLRVTRAGQAATEVTAGFVGMLVANSSLI